MLNEVKTRNYSRYQKLHMYLTANASVYSSYLPFNREAQSFITNFNLFKIFVPQNDANSISITNSQKELKNRIALQVANICDMAIAYAEQYNDDKLEAAINYNKYDVLFFKDSEIYALVSSIINVLQPMLADQQFMEYDITEEMLESVMADALTFADNLETNSWINTGSSVACQTINEIIKKLDRNVQQFDRLINRFAATHPEFVAGYHMNTSLENPITYYTGIKSDLTSGADGNLISNSLLSIASQKGSPTEAIGNFAIINIHNCDCVITVDTSGFTFKTTAVHIPNGKTGEVNMA